MLPHSAPPPAPQPASSLAPPGAVDCHVHLLAGDEFPLWDKRVEDPAQGINFDGWIDLYRAHLAALGISKGVIVHSILYGTDNAVTRAAVARMGPGFKGVGLLPDDASDTDLDGFVTDNLAAIRLNYVHGGVLSWAGARAMAPRLADRGLHIQMLLHCDQHMEEIASDIPDLGVPLVIDHLGWPRPDVTVDSPGFQTLLRLLADGHIYLKCAAPYRMANAPYGRMDPFITAAIAANPDRILWGSDWPYIMLGTATQPTSGAALLAAFDRNCPDNATRHKILTENPSRLFHL